MLENSRRNRKLVAGAAGVNLALALAVGAGAVSGRGHGGDVRAVALAAEPLAGPIARQPGDVVKDVAAAVVPTTLPPVATTTVAPRPTAAPPTTAKARPAATSTAAALSAPSTASPAPAATAPAAPVKVPRRVPSAAEVDTAIATLPQYVRTPFTPTPAQVAQLGDQVCTAFDQGQTFAQVKTTGLQMVTQVPFTTVLPGGADWVVKTAVALYCPGHSSKLV